MSEMKFDFDVNSINLDTATTDGFVQLETGWYKMALVEIGEPVVVYGTAYDEKVNDPSNKTVDEDYYYREFYGE